MECFTNFAYDLQTNHDLCVSPIKGMIQKNTDNEFKEIKMEMMHLPGYREKHKFFCDLDANKCDQLPVFGNKVKDLTLVIVGNNKYLLKFLNDSLSLSYNCYEARNGREGFGLTTRIIPDMLISEVSMPKMNGYELCERMKGTQKTCHIPIILLTEQNEFEQLVAGYEKGADACVAKPLKMNVLKAQVSRLIKNRELIKSKYVAQNFMIDISSSNLTIDEELITKMRQLLEENISDSDFKVHELATGLNISKTTLYRKIKRLTGHSPIEFILLFKMQRACELLSNKDSIKMIGNSLGFKGLSYFSMCFKKQFGVTPLVFREKGIPT